MRRLLLSATLLVLLIPSRADAFIFTDLIAKVQRIQMIAQAAKTLEQIDSYRKEFDKYKTEFDKYYQNFRRIYRRLSSLDWRDFTPSDWRRLSDHLITIWKTFDEEAWQTQVLALRISPLYSSSPDYKEYADKLVKLSEDQVTQLKKEEAHLIELQAQDAAHHEALERFKSNNAALVIGDDTPGSEVAISQQIALTNAILIERPGRQPRLRIATGTTSASSTTAIRPAPALASSRPSWRWPWMNTPTTPPASSVSCTVRSASRSGSPRRTPNVPPMRRKAPNGRGRNSSALAMKRIARGWAAPIAGMSHSDWWLATNTTAPLRGTSSRPLIRARSRPLNIGSAHGRTSSQKRSPEGTGRTEGEPR